MTAERAAAGAAAQARQAELDKEAAVSSAYEETARAQGEAARAIEARDAATARASSVEEAAAASIAATKAEQAAAVERVNAEKAAAVQYWQAFSHSPSKTDLTVP